MVVLDGRKIHKITTTLSSMVIVLFLITNLQIFSNSKVDGVLDFIFQLQIQVQKIL